jgi:hypothetical protein
VDGKISITHNTCFCPCQNIASNCLSQVNRAQRIGRARTKRDGASATLLVAFHLNFDLESLVAMPLNDHL